MFASDVEKIKVGTVLRRREDLVLSWLNRTILMLKGDLAIVLSEKIIVGENFKFFAVGKIHEFVFVPVVWEFVE